MKKNDELNDLEKEEIVSIKYVGKKPTIDIEVEDTHMFFANDIYTHNSGINAEIITMEAISEAFSKCFVADFIFSLSRTAKDKNANTGRIFIAKNRFGPDGLTYPVFADYTHARIKVIKGDGEYGNFVYDMEDEGKSDKDKLKDKMLSIRNEMKNKNGGK